MYVSALIEGMEAPLPRGKARATHGERGRVPRKTGERARRDSGGGTEGVKRNGSDRKPEVLPIFGS